jgi:conjugative transfer signal peptidase TraF
VTSPALIGVAVGIGLLWSSAVAEKRPILVWNASASAPIGLYLVIRQPPRLADHVLVRLPPRFAALAARRGYLARRAYLLKPVAASQGDQVCRLGTHISVRGRLAARAKLRDRLGRALPTWHGCHKIQSGELFLLAAASDSFDSRYFGAVSEHADRAIPVWPLRRGHP